MNVLQINHNDQKVIKPEFLKKLIQTANIVFATSNSIKRLFGTKRTIHELALELFQYSNGTDDKYIIITQVYSDFV